MQAEAAALAREGHQVHVVAPSSDPTRLSNEDGVRAWPVAHGGVFGWPGAAARLRAAPWRAPGAALFAWRAAVRIAALRPDHVIAHWLVPSAFPIAVRAPSTASLCCVAHGGDVRLLISMPAPLRSRVLSRVLDRAAEVRFVASALLEDLRASLDPSTRRRLDAVAVVRPCSIEVPDVAKRATELRAAHRGVYLMTTVGRLVPSKRVDLSVAAANLLGPGVKLCVVGDGPERERLSALDGVGNVTFVGQTARSEALAWMAASSAVIHASAVEAAPTVVREARVLGVPVVACDAGDVANWARDDRGIRVVEASAPAIAEAVEALRRSGRHMHDDWQ